MSTVYLETSYLSACVTDRADAASIYRRQSSMEWWRLFRSPYELVSSAEVVSELSDPAFPQRDRALALINGIDLLDIDAEVIGVALVFVRDQVMPGPVAGDAIHVAAAAVHGVDFMLS